MTRHFLVLKDFCDNPKSPKKGQVLQCGSYQGGPYGLSDLAITCWTAEGLIEETLNSSSPGQSKTLKHPSAQIAILCPSGKPVGASAESTHR